jgi:hypothetical protein
MRPPRRHCPALEREICAPCCGEGREETISCPLECEYLREARRHEKQRELDGRQMPHPEIELTDKVMQQNQPLAIVTGRLLLVAALEVQGTVDADMGEALDALVRTMKTADSGLVYETRPSNGIAAAVMAQFQDEMAKFREHIAEQSGSHSVRDKDLLAVLVFWQRMEWQHHNGRRRSRSFIESLYGVLPPPAEDGNLVQG